MDRPTRIREPSATDPRQREAADAAADAAGGRGQGVDTAQYTPEGAQRQAACLAAGHAADKAARGVARVARVAERAEIARHLLALLGLVTVGLEAVGWALRARSTGMPSESFGFEPRAQQSFQVNFSGLVKKLSGQAHFAAAAPSSLSTRGFLCVLHLHRKPNCRTGRARSAQRRREPTIPSIPAPPSWPPATEGSFPSLVHAREPSRPT